MNYVLDYAENNDIHTIEGIYNANLIDDFMINVIGDLENEILNLKKYEYDLNVINDYLDKLVRILKLDDNTYENMLRCKTHNLFKLGDYDLGMKKTNLKDLDILEERKYYFENK